MIRVIGAILVTAATTSVGLSVVQRLSQRVRILSGLIAALETIQSEIYFNLTPLPLIVEQLAERSAEAVRPFFKTCAVCMRRLEDQSFAALWRHAVLEHQSNFRQAEAQLLADLGGTLGKYDVETQARSIANTRNRLEALRDEAEKERARQGKVYSMLGVMCGLTIVIIFI